VPLGYGKILRGQTCRRKKPKKRSGEERESRGGETRTKKTGVVHSEATFQKRGRIPRTKKFPPNRGKRNYARKLGQGCQKLRQPTTKRGEERGRKESDIVASGDTSKIDNWKKERRLDQSDRERTPLESSN